MFLREAETHCVWRYSWMVDFTSAEEAVESGHQQAQDTEAGDMLYRAPEVWVPK